MHMTTQNTPELKTLPIMGANGCAHWADRAMMALRFEKTSVDPIMCRPVSVALILVLPDGTVERKICCVINAGVDVPEDATAIHGISTEKVRTIGRSVDHVMYDLLHALVTYSLSGCPLVIYNARFDWQLLATESKRHNLVVPDLPIFDPLLIDRTVDSYRRGGRKLSQVCDHYGVTYGLWHDAEADCVAAVGVARAILKRQTFLRDYSPSSLHTQQAEWHSEWASGMNQYFARKNIDKHIDPNWP